MEQNTNTNYLIGKGFASDYIAKYLKTQMLTRIMLPGFSAEDTIRDISSSAFFYDIMKASGFESDQPEEEVSHFEQGVRDGIRLFNQ